MVNEETPRSISYPQWWCPGTGMMYNRDCLPPDHPESAWNYCSKKYPGVDLTLFNIPKPRKRCPHCGGYLEEEI